MPKVKVSPEFELASQLLTDFRNLWIEKSQKSKVDPMLFSRLSVVALTQLAAIVAVDVGMQPEQFLAVCNAQFLEAHKNAPRFA
jgi:hypothetical protein